MGWWLAGFVLALAACVRILAAGSDPWLDEVWSLALVGSFQSFSEVFTSVPETNNHLLNSLWLFWLGDGASAYAMRVPSLLLGTAAVALGGVLGARNSNREALLVMALLGGSYLMIDAASEARGYAPMAFFALLAWIALEAGFVPGARSRGGWGAVFVASVVLGTLFQFSFVIAYAALSAGWLVQRLGDRPDARGWLREAGVWHAVPVVFYAVLYGVWVRHVSIGGDALPLQFVIERIAMLAVGIEGQGPALKWGASIAALVFVAAFGIGVQRDRPRAAIYFVGIIAAPAVLIAGLESSFLAPRYFGFSIVVFLIAGGGILGALATSGRWGAGVACVLLALFLAVNARTAAPLLYQGRGEYARALQLMDRESARGPLEIGLRLQFRHGMVLRYFAQQAVPERSLRFVTPEDWPRRGPEWLVVASRKVGETFGVETRGPRGNVYRRVEGFEGVPGREPAWFLYRAVRGPGERGRR